MPEHTASSRCTIVSMDDSITDLDEFVDYLRGRSLEELRQVLCRWDVVAPNVNAVSAPLDEIGLLKTNVEQAKREQRRVDKETEQACAQADALEDAVHRKQEAARQAKEKREAEAAAAAGFA